MRSTALQPSRGGLVLRGVVLAYLSLLVVVPLAALVWIAFRAGLAAFWTEAWLPVARDAVWRTLWTAAAMTAVNAVMGTATAWVLVRRRFPGRTLLSSLVDLPFAIPTLVTGVMLALLFGPNEPVGRWMEAHGVPVVYTNIGIVLALSFVTLPFVVRAVEPVLMELDMAEEEAAQTLGASGWLTFRRVILPALLPAITVGALQAFARAVAEFGSVVVISGNVPFRTLTAPIYVFGEVEGGRPEAAAAVSVVLLVVALALTATTRLLRGGGRGSRHA